MVCALLLLLCVLETAVAPSSSRANRDALLSAGRFGLSNTLIVAHLPKTREPRYYLEYLTLRGLAELPVLMLERSGVSYAATYWSKSDWNAHAKATTPLGRVPVLRGVGPKQPHSLVKTTLAQSGTIVRYLGRALALDGGDVDYNLRPRADMWYETVVELFGSAKFDAAALDGDAMSEVRYAETSNRGGAWSPLERAMAVLHTFEDALPEAGAPQRGLLAALAAPRLTYADLALFLKLEALGDASLPRRFAALRRFRDWVARDPNVKAYLSSDRRIPRTVRRESPTPDYYYSRGAGGAIESESTTLRPGGELNPEAQGKGAVSSATATATTAATATAATDTATAATDTASPSPPSTTEVTKRRKKKKSRKTKKQKAHRSVVRGRALYTAAEAGDAAAVAKLLSAGAAVDAPIDGATALMVAAWGGHAGATEKLIAAGANVDAARASDGATALMLAASSGELLVVKLLLAAGADADALAAGVAGTAGTTPLMLAAANGDASLVELLIVAGADVNAARASDGATPLVIATTLGHNTIAKYIYDASTLSIEEEEEEEEWSNSEDGEL